MNSPVSNDSIPIVPSFTVSFSHLLLFPPTSPPPVFPPADQPTDQQNEQHWKCGEW